MVVPEEFRGQAADIMDEVRQGRSWSGEFVVRHRDGTAFPVEATDTPVFDEDGDMVGVIAVLKNITERKEAERERDRQARDVALRAEVSAALAEGGTLRGVLQRCAEAIVERLDAAFARIWTLDDEGKTLELQASAGAYTNLDGGHSRVPVGSFKIGLITEERLPHLTNDLGNDPRVSDRQWAEREGMAAFAGYPLIVEDSVVGGMAMFARKPLDENTIEALASVADAIAQGIKRKGAEEQLRYRAFHAPLTRLPNLVLQPPTVAAAEERLSGVLRPVAHNGGMATESCAAGVRELPEGVRRWASRHGGVVAVGLVGS